MRSFIYIIALLIAPYIVEARGYKSIFEEDHRIVLWDNTTAPSSNELEGDAQEPRPHRVTNTTVAELLIFEAAEDQRTGQAVVICPGGGYGTLSMDSEGADVAKWFAANGITAAVLKYRLPNGHKEVPFDDGVEALRKMREMSEQLQIDSTKIGIVGFSAGGHLAAYISTLAPKESKPNFSILFYPVITSEKGLSHIGSFNNLMGKDRTEFASSELSLENRVDENTPPAIIFHSSDDKGVPAINSTLYYNALHANRIAASLYIFPYGGHGWGITDRVEFRSDWQKLLLDWLAFTDKESAKLSKTKK